MISLSKLERSLDLFDADKCVISLGDYVQSPFGIGTVQRLNRANYEIYEITIDSWKLATGKSPVLYSIPSVLKKVSSDKFDILQTLSELTAAVESSGEEHHALGCGPGICGILKRFLDLEVIAKRPLCNVYYDRVCEEFLRLIVKLARRTLDKSTANLAFIEAICDPDLNLLRPIVQIMAEHMSSSVVSKLVFYRSNNLPTVLNV
jgi:hypothetical protein